MLRETTSRGRCELVCPSRMLVNDCLLVLIIIPFESEGALVLKTDPVFPKVT